MKYLLDTHIFLWWLQDHPSLSPEAKATIIDPKVVICVSAASFWEIAIKKKLGKIKYSGNLTKELEKNSFQGLSISPVHALETGKLPDHHKDPFDRILIAQARIEKITLITSDQAMTHYKLPLLFLS